MVCPAIGLPPRRKDPLCGRGGSVSPPAHQEVLPSRPPAHGTVGQPSVARVSGREPLGGRRGAIVAGDGRLGVGDGEGGKGRCCRRLLCVVAAVVAAAATTVRLWVRQAHGRSRPTCGGVWAYAQGAQWPHPGRACPQLRWRSHRDWQLATEVVGAPAAAPTHGAATVGRGRGGGDVLGEAPPPMACSVVAAAVRLPGSRLLVLPSPLGHLPLRSLPPPLFALRRWRQVWPPRPSHTSPSLVPLFSPVEPAASALPSADAGARQTTLVPPLSE